jgi:isopentenyl diphosphate isomerase/L-lactate dehydrogenase-like FMN-dependent dehydrogenase
LETELGKVGKIETVPIEEVVSHASGPVFQQIFAVGGKEAIAPLADRAERSGVAALVVDGGVRSGTDIVRAVCLGARAVLVGRAAIFGLAAGGEPGVRRVLELLKTGVDQAVRTRLSSATWTRP